MIQLIRNHKHLKRILKDDLTLLLVYGNSKFTIGDGDCVEDTRYYCRLYHPLSGVKFYKMYFENAVQTCADNNIKKIPAFLFFKDKKLIKVLYGPQSTKILKVELGLTEY